jgi:hypothetical protein
MSEIIIDYDLYLSISFLDYGEEMVSTRAIQEKEIKFISLHATSLF